MTQTLSQSELQTFVYEKPEVMDHPKKTVNMVRGGVLGFGIQVVKEGGETNLHAHAAAESLWFVLKGRARFYDTEEGVFGDYGPMEGIGIPRAAPYWFESSSDETLEIMHITAVNKQAQNTRLNFNALRGRQEGRHEGSVFRDLTKHHAKPMQSIKYESPDLGDLPKQSVNLYNNGDMLRIGIQKVQHGGETNLHAHSGADSAWFVLRGSARFYGANDADKFDLGMHEGIFIPHGVPYWFESTSSEPLEIFHVTARDTRVEKNERVNYEALKDWQQERGLGGRDATAEDPR